MFDLIVAGSNNDDELNQVLKMPIGTKYYPMIPTKGQGILSGKLDKNGKIIPDNQETVPEGLIEVVRIDLGMQSQLEYSSSSCSTYS